MTGGAAGLVHGKSTEYFGLIVEDAKPCDLGEIHTRIQAVLARVERARRIPLTSVRMSGEPREAI